MEDSSTEATAPLCLSDWSALILHLLGVKRPELERSAKRFQHAINEEIRRVVFVYAPGLPVGEYVDPLEPLCDTPKPIQQNARANPAIFDCVWPTYTPYVPNAPNSVLSPLLGFDSCLVNPFKDRGNSQSTKISAIYNQLLVDAAAVTQIEIDQTSRKSDFVTVTTPKRLTITDSGSRLFVIDCRVVQTKGKKLELAQFSLTDSSRRVVYSTYVQPCNKISNYLTEQYGITPSCLAGVTTRQKDVITWLKNYLKPGDILIGSGISFWLSILKIFHSPVVDIRALFWHVSSTLKLLPSIKRLAAVQLNRTVVGNGSPSSPAGIAATCLDLLDLKVLLELESCPIDLGERLNKIGKTVAVVDQNLPIWIKNRPYTTTCCECSNNRINLTIELSASHDLVVCNLASLGEDQANGTSQENEKSLDILLDKLKSGLQEKTLIIVCSNPINLYKDRVPESCPDTRLPTREDPTELVLVFTTVTCQDKSREPSMKPDAQLGLVMTTLATAEEEVKFTSVEEGTEEPPNGLFGDPGELNSSMTTCSAELDTQTKLELELKAMAAIELSPAADSDAEGEAKSGADAGVEAVKVAESETPEAEQELPLETETISSPPQPVNAELPEEEAVKSAGLIPKPESPTTDSKTLADEDLLEPEPEPEPVPKSDPETEPDQQIHTVPATTPTVEADLDKETLDGLSQSSVHGALTEKDIPHSSESVMSADAENFDFQHPTDNNPHTRGWTALALYVLGFKDEALKRRTSFLRLKNVAPIKRVIAIFCPEIPAVGIMKSMGKTASKDQISCNPVPSFEMFDSVYLTETLSNEPDSAYREFTEVSRTLLASLPKDQWTSGKQVPKSTFSYADLLLSDQERTILCIPKANKAESVIIQNGDVPATVEPKHLLFVHSVRLSTVTGRLQLARFAVFGIDKKMLFHSLIKPPEPFKSYQTSSTGLKEEHFEGVVTTVQDVRDWLRDNLKSHHVIVGHHLASTLCTLKIQYPRAIDTAMLYRDPSGSLKKPDLKLLAQSHLGTVIPSGPDHKRFLCELSAIVDLVKKKFESGLAASHPKGQSAADLPGTLKSIGKRTAIHGDFPAWEGRDGVTNVKCIDHERFATPVLKLAKDHDLTISILTSPQNPSNSGKSRHSALDPNSYATFEKQIKHLLLASRKDTLLLVFLGPVFIRNSGTEYKRVVTFATLKTAPDPLPSKLWMNPNVESTARMLYKLLHQAKTNLSPASQKPSNLAPRLNVRSKSETKPEPTPKPLVHEEMKAKHDTQSIVESKPEIQQEAEQQEVEQGSLLGSSVESKPEIKQEAEQEEVEQGSLLGSSVESKPEIKQEAEQQEVEQGSLLGSSVESKPEIKQEAEQQEVQQGSLLGSVAPKLVPRLVSGFLPGQITGSVLEHTQVAVATGSSATGSSEAESSHNTMLGLILNGLVRASANELQPDGKSCDSSTRSGDVESPQPELELTDPSPQPEASNNSDLNLESTSPPGFIPSAKTPSPPLSGSNGAKSRVASDSSLAPLMIEVAAARALAANPSDHLAQKCVSLGAHTDLSEVSIMELNALLEWCKTTNEYKAESP